MSLHSDDPKLQLAIIGDMLVGASDRAGEALAHAADMGDMDEQALENLMGINLAIWTARWEMGLMGGSAQYGARAKNSHERVGGPVNTLENIRTADVQPKTATKGSERVEAAGITSSDVQPKTAHRTTHAESRKQP